MDPIYPRSFIASEVAVGRMNDQALHRQGRPIHEDAVARVARRTGLPPETVAQIAAEEAHAAYLAEQQACRGCDACTNNCGRRELVAA